MPNRPMTDRSPFELGMKGVCPHCGEGRLFDGYLTLAKGCRACGLDYDFADAGDGPAVFVTLIVGAIVAGLALFLQFKVQAPIWVNFLICIPLLIVLSLATLRPLKGIMIALQYRNAAREGRLEGRD